MTPSHYITCRHIFNRKIIKAFYMDKFIYICFSYFIFSCPASASENVSLIDKYITLAITGDLRQAQPLFQNVALNGNTGEQVLATRFRSRFVDKSEPFSPRSGDAFVDALVTAYRAYWSESLVPGDSVAEAESQLGRALAQLLMAHAPSAIEHQPLEEVQAGIRQAVESKGYYAQLGPAPPLQELLLWKNQRREVFPVTLSDLERVVEVVFVSDFLSQGWKHYAALGLATTTGWIENGRLYCVDGIYAAGSEAFEVSYLKHESRHLVDFEQFPDLSLTELEFRAKLTELAFASKTLNGLLVDFTAKSAADSGSPHAEANARVIDQLYRALYDKPFPGGADAWTSVSVGKVNRAARELLQRDSSRRRRM